MSGRLYICATPIGNLEDVTLRLLRVLDEVDVIAAEDTRRTRKLLTHHGIKGRLISLHEHNERTQVPYLVQRLQAGEKIAVVSDAGMPAISDPGHSIISACIEAGIALEVLPGPSSVLSALVLSGLPAGRFCFEGYLPRKAGEQRRRLSALADDDRTLVVFEAPGRVRTTLENVSTVFGRDRPMALVRELTKVHEEVIRGTVAEVMHALGGEILGEIVLVFGGASGSEIDAMRSAVDFARQLVDEGKSKSQASAQAAAMFKVPRRSVYESFLATQ